MTNQHTFGFARMRAEPGERRDFLPETIALLDKLKTTIFLEHGYGSGMGFSEADYLKSAPSVIFTNHEEVYQQDYVVVLRCPEHDVLELLNPSSCLISMLHFPTRPQRTEFLRNLVTESISLDSLKDDVGRRLVKNLRAVGWNGIEAAFRTLRIIYPSPGFESPSRQPIHVTLLGSGAIGTHVVQASIRHGDISLWNDMNERGIPGVQVTVVDFDTTLHKEIMLEILSKTDILVDATQRPDPSKSIIPNDWIQVMPKYAILLDLSVDPYVCDFPPISVKGIEGIPQGNLDQYVFAPDDPAFDEIPECIPNAQRRYVVSCYSWPGIHPIECMEVYGKQLRPIFRTLVEKGGVDRISSRGNFFERAINRAKLSNWNSA